MGLEEAKQEQNRLYNIMIIIGIVFVSFNLRPGITSVGPLFGMIREDLSLASWGAGLLTSLPLLAFALISPIAPTFGRRLSNERAILVGLFFLVIGIGVRSISWIVFLFFGTFLVGLGIAICNVLLPGFIKEKYPLKVALMTGVYSTMMSVFAASASGLSIPFAVDFQMGWQVALLVWGLPAIIAIVVWIYLDKHKKSKEKVEMRYITPSSKGGMWKSPLAWQIALFMGLQSTMFYVTISWLPEILTDYGVSLVTAGWFVSLAQFIGLPASFIVPIIAGKFASQRLLVTVLSIMMISGFTGLWLGSSTWMLIICITLIGISLSGNFALALTFLGLRARTSTDAAELSGMAQSIGYLLAAVGPFAIGLLFDITQTWEIPLIVLICNVGVMYVFGLFAGRNKYVLD